MTVADLMAFIKAERITGNPEKKQLREDIYCCDILSKALAKLSAGSIWITIQTGVSIVAVAVQTGLGCIVVAEGVKVPEATLIRAELENIVLLSTPLSVYETAWRLHEFFANRTTDTDVEGKKPDSDD